MMNQYQDNSTYESYESHRDPGVQDPADYRHEPIGSNSDTFFHPGMQMKLPMKRREERQKREEKTLLRHRQEQLQRRNLTRSSSRDEQNQYSDDVYDSFTPPIPHDSPATPHSHIHRISQSGSFSLNSSHGSAGYVTTRLNMDDSSARSQPVTKNMSNDLHSPRSPIRPRPVRPQTTSLPQMGYRYSATHPDSYPQDQYYDYNNNYEPCYQPHQPMYQPYPPPPPASYHASSFEEPNEEDINVISPQRHVRYPSDNSLHFDPHQEYRHPPSPIKEAYRGGKSPYTPPLIAASFDSAQTSSSSFSMPDVPYVSASTVSLCPSLSQVNRNDVLCGRGGGTNSQVGNRHFRKLVQDHQPVYLQAKRKEKPMIAKKIVKIIRSRGGRFLKKEETSEALFEVGDDKAEAKTSQALREGLDVRASKKEESIRSQREDEGRITPVTKNLGRKRKVPTINPASPKVLTEDDRKLFMEFEPPKSRARKDDSDTEGLTWSAV